MVNEVAGTGCRFGMGGWLHERDGAGGRGLRRRYDPLEAAEDGEYVPGFAEAGAEEDPAGKEARGRGRGRALRLAALAAVGLGAWAFGVRQGWVPALPRLPRLHTDTPTAEQREAADLALVSALEEEEEAAAAAKGEPAVYAATETVLHRGDAGRAGPDPSPRERGWRDAIYKGSTGEPVAFFKRMGKKGGRGHLLDWAFERETFAPDEMEPEPAPAPADGPDGGEEATPAPTPEPPAAEPPAEEKLVTFVSEPKSQQGRRMAKLPTLLVNFYSTNCNGAHGANAIRCPRFQRLLEKIPLGPNQRFEATLGAIKAAGKQLQSGVASIKCLHPCGQELDQVSALLLELAANPVSAYTASWREDKGAALERKFGDEAAKGQEQQRQTEERRGAWKRPEIAPPPPPVAAKPWKARPGAVGVKPEEAEEIGEPEVTAPPPEPEKTAEELEREQLEQEVEEETKGKITVIGGVLRPKIKKNGKFKGEYETGVTHVALVDPQKLHKPRRYGGADPVDVVVEAPGAEEARERDRQRAAVAEADDEIETEILASPSDA